MFYTRKISLIAPILTLAVCMPVVAVASSTLDLATTLMTVAAFYPQKLIDDPPLKGSTPAEMAAWQVIRPCLQKIRGGYEAALPRLTEDLRRVQISMGDEQAKTTAAYAAWNEATSYIRGMRISELAITEGADLANDPDFKFEQGLVAVMNAQNEAIKQNNRNVPFTVDIVKKAVDAMQPVYRNKFQADCLL